MIVHDTPGLIDLRSFTTFGVNAKPRAASPIGFFGTGLKYAIAVLVREGLKVTVWIGTEPHEFYCEPSQFRGKDFNLIRMRRQRGVTRKWMANDLPFTTELGKNWKLWMALRELHSNTLDEGGTTYAALYSNGRSDIIGAEDRTHIVVEGDAYKLTYAELGSIFLPNRGVPKNYVCIVDQELAHGYYRGMRVLDLQRPSIFTYSVEIDLTLTEDRTTSSWMWDYYVRHAIMGLTNENIIRRILQAKDDTYESSIIWDASEYTYCTPEFLRCVSLYGKKSTYVFAAHEKQKIIREQLSWRRVLLNAMDANDSDEIVSAVRANSVPLRALLNRTYSDDEREADAKLTAEAASSNLSRKL